MDPAPLDLEKLILTLAKHAVKFVVIGGAAALVHGSPLGTDDVDIVIAPNPENKRKLERALRTLHARRRVAGRTYAWTGFRGEPDEILYRFSTDAGLLDVATHGLVGHYDNLIANSDVVELANVNFHVVTLDMLIAMKREAGRPKDELTLAWLREVRAQKGTQQ